jgi:hypothetical protein
MVRFGSSLSRMFMENRAYTSLASTTSSSEFSRGFRPFGSFGKTRRFFLRVLRCSVLDLLNVRDIPWRVQFSLLNYDVVLGIIHLVHLLHVLLSWFYRSEFYWLHCSRLCVLPEPDAGSLGS